MSALREFVGHLEASLGDDSFRRLTLGKLGGELKGQLKISVRLLTLQKGRRMSFVHRFADHEITRNHPLPEGLQMVKDWLGKSSLAATLLTSKSRKQLQFSRDGKSRISSGLPEQFENSSRHDRKKKRRIEDESFLRPLGILSAEGRLQKTMGDKYRQIHHFIELLAPTTARLSRKKPLRIVDLAAGKGYLTFAVFAYLRQAGFNPQVIGIERRRPLVDLCNQAAQICGFEELRFAVGEIANTRLDGADIVIALHACDTATDEAIHAAIVANAQIILIAPCCHRELRPQLRPPADLSPLFRYGIQIDRMAETITDTLRSMYLEASGYLTRIQEFISLEHTAKNLLIIGTKRSEQGTNQLLLQKALEFQRLFGIHHQRLGDLLLAREWKSGQ